MQIMEGDVIRTIQDEPRYFGHYHTGGNPGRHELDDTQELFYPPIIVVGGVGGGVGRWWHSLVGWRCSSSLIIVDHGQFILNGGWWLLSPILVLIW